MTAEERQDEVAQILAAGLVRLLQKREYQNNRHRLEKNSLDFSPDRSGHAYRTAAERGPAMSDTVLALIAALKTRSTSELRDMWRELFDKEPPVLAGIP